MRWSYKTVHYELKKEGLLGSTFLDEAEVEESLNEFGHAGWELVSLIEVKDGLIAVFKQPLDQFKGTQSAINYQDIDESSEMDHEPLSGYSDYESDQETELASPVNDHYGQDREVDYEYENNTDDEYTYDSQSSEDYGVDEDESEEHDSDKKERKIGEIRIE